MSTLAFKFGTLFLKQLSKPVASRVKEFVLKHPAWRKRALNLSRAVHRWEIWATQAARTGDPLKKVVIGEMVEDKAIELASNMVSETFIFSHCILMDQRERLSREGRPCKLLVQVAAVLLMVEYNRNQTASMKKQAIEEHHRRELQAAAMEQRQTLMRENKEQYLIIAELQQRVEKLEQVMAAEENARKSWWRKSHGASAVAHIDPPLGSKDKHE